MSDIELLDAQKFYVWHDPAFNTNNGSKYLTGSVIKSWATGNSSVDTSTFNKGGFWYSAGVNGDNGFNFAPAISLYFKELNYDVEDAKLTYNMTLCGLNGTGVSGGWSSVTSSSNQSSYNYKITIGFGVYEKGNESGLTNVTNSGVISANTSSLGDIPNSVNTSHDDKITKANTPCWILNKDNNGQPQWGDVGASGTITINGNVLSSSSKYYLCLLIYTTCPSDGCGQGTRVFSLIKGDDPIPQSDPTISGTVTITCSYKYLKNNEEFTTSSATYNCSSLSSEGPSCAISKCKLETDSSYTPKVVIQARIYYYEANSTTLKNTGWRYRFYGMTEASTQNNNGNYRYYMSIGSNSTGDKSAKDTDQINVEVGNKKSYSIGTFGETFLEKFGRPVYVQFRATGYLDGYTDSSHKLTTGWTDTETVYLKLTNYTDKDETSLMSYKFSSSNYLYGDYLRIKSTNSKFNGNNKDTVTSDNYVDDRASLSRTSSNTYIYSETPSIVINSYNLETTPEESYLITLNSQGIAILNSQQSISCYLRYRYSSGIARNWIDSDSVTTGKAKVQLRIPNAPRIEILTKENCNPKDVESARHLEGIYFLDPYNTYNSSSVLSLTIGLPIALYATYNGESESGENWPQNLYHIFYRYDSSDGSVKRIYSKDSHSNYYDYGLDDNDFNKDTGYYWQYPCQWDSSKSDLTDGGITDDYDYKEIKVKNSFDPAVYDYYRALNSDYSNPSREIEIYHCPRYLPNNDTQVYKPSGGQQVCNEEISGIDGYVPIDSKTGNSTTTFSYLFYLDYDGDWDNSEGQEEQDLPYFDELTDDELEITVTSKIYISFTNLHQRYNLGRFDYAKLDIIHSADNHKIPINGTEGESIYSTTIDLTEVDDEINKYDSNVDYINLHRTGSQYGFGNYEDKMIKHLVIDISKIISQDLLESNHYYKFRLTCGYAKYRVVGNDGTITYMNIFDPSLETAPNGFLDSKSKNTNVFTSSQQFKFNVRPLVQILYPTKDETTGKVYSSNPYPYTIFKVYNNEKLTDLGYRIDEVKITYTDTNEEDSREIKWIDEMTDSNDKTTGYFPTMNLSTDKNWQSMTYDNRVTNFTTQKQGDYEFPDEPIDYLGGEVTRGQIVVYRHNAMDNVQNGSNYPKFKVTCKNYFGWSDEEEDNSIIDYFYYNELNDAINNSSNKTKENDIAITDTQYILGNDVNDFLRSIQYLIPKGSSSTLVTGSWWNYNIVNLFYDFISTQNKIDNEDMSIIDKLIKSDKVDDIHNNYWLTTMMNDFLRELYHRIWALDPIRPNNLSYEISMDSNSDVVYGVIDKNLLLQSLHYIYGNYILFYCKENDGWYMISDEYSYDNNYNVTLTVDDDFKIIPINDDFFKNKDNLDNYCVKLKDNEFYSLGLQIISGNKNNLYTGYFIYIHIDSPSYIEGGEIDKNKYGNIIYGNNDYKDNKSKIKNNDYYIGNLVNNIVDYLTEMLS